jgi:hypothetical protein
MGVSSRWLEAGRARVGASEVPDISNLGAGLAAEDLVANAGVTGVVLKAEQSSNNDKGDVEKTFQVACRIKKATARGGPAPSRAAPPQMDAPVQYTALAEIPATSPADAHSTKKFRDYGRHGQRTQPVVDERTQLRRARNSAAGLTPRVFCWLLAAAQDVCVSAWVLGVTFTFLMPSYAHPPDPLTACWGWILQ